MIPSPKMIKFKKGVFLSRAVNFVLWGTESPSPTEKSIGRQYRKNKKLRNKINKFLRKYIGGTTIRACKQLHRKYIGIDISDNYCRIANTIQELLFEGGW